MCGRYAMGVRMAFVRRRLQDQGMSVDEAPDDDELRETYNFAPGYYGAVYRADTADHGFEVPEHDGDAQEGETEGGNATEADGDKQGDDGSMKYKLQKMRWGLIPFWTKRQPDYGSMMRTINCRDDSLMENRGMWTSMKKKKRCIVVCQGFYEWLKKGPGGKEKVPHFIKRKDGDLMCFAGLWDCVQYEGSDEKLYTYTIITTDSNPYLKFLHDRMPVILDPGSEAIKTWLDPRRTTWSKELQSLLKPYKGELECYPVAKEVGKVGNNSPDFIVPVNSRQNKNNIANFFANADKKNDVKGKPDQSTSKLEPKGMHAKADERKTKDDAWTEDNAPKPSPKEEPETSPRCVKRELSPDDTAEQEAGTPKAAKTEVAARPSRDLQSHSPVKEGQKKQGRPMRSATKNNASPAKSKNYGTSKKARDGSQRITNFFTR